MKKTTLGICFIASFAVLLILAIACQKEKDNAGAVVKKEKLTGTIQKGPYAEASVSLYELNPSLERTGKVFNGRIISNGGPYEIANIALSSQYAELKANGYYFDEVSGTASSYHLSLSAISDIKDLQAVNINILTHLEKERIKYLIEKGRNFTAAKDTAQKEILSFFGISFSDMDKSEKLDITVNNEQNAILLAVSIILQGDRSTRDLTELLTVISNDMLQDGMLDDDTILLKLRNSTLTLDLPKIRSNLENKYRDLGISASIPDFEKYINDFLVSTGLAPTPETFAASNITATGATLNGSVKANDLSTTVTFEYGTTTGYESSISATPGVVTGHTFKPVSATLSELSPGTPYHFRIKTVNSKGESYGTDFNFTTLGKVPEATTGAATNISSTGATLNGTVNPNELSTTVLFEYGTTETYGNIVNAMPQQVTGRLVNNVSAGLTGLNPGTIYHFRIKTVNLLGPVFGNDLTFTTLGKIPLAITQAATNLLADGATLHGTVNANDLTTTVIFEYGLTETYGSSVSALPGQVTGNSTTSVSGVISGLVYKTTYHYRVKAENSLGIVYGDDLTFTTSGDIPAAATQAASNLSTDGATLNATVNSNSLITTVTFEYGLTETYGNTISAIPGQVSGNLNTNLIGLVTGLVYNTTYHYRVKAENPLGIVYGGDIAFRTLGELPYAVTKDATNIRSTSATLNGVVNANGFSTEVFFELGLSTSYGSTMRADQSPVNGGNNTFVSFPVISFEPETQYHFRIKATNYLGTTYGNDNTFVTPPAFVKDIEGNSYSVVLIGQQQWLAENLRATRFNDNSLLPLVTDNSQWASLLTPGYCWYNNDQLTFQQAYGALYNWYVVDSLSNGGKNVCPTGWHPASKSDWLELITYIGGTQSGYKLKETGTVHWPSPNSNSTNETGFTGLPGGLRAQYGQFSNVGWLGSFLSSTPEDYYVHHMTLTYDGLVDPYYWYQKNVGGSIRCLKDK